jgi:hypothetical protein
VKNIVFIGIILLASFAKAQVPGRPYQLDDGKYTLECWSVSSEIIDGRIKSATDYQKGQGTVSTQNGVSIENFDFQNEDESVRVSMERRNSFVELGDGKFLQRMELLAKNKKVVFEVTVKVDGKHTLFVSGTKDGFPIDVTGRDFQWQKMKDGRVIADDYILSTIATDKNRLHGHTQCHFAKQ